MLSTSNAACTGGSLDGLPEGTTCCLGFRYNYNSQTQREWCTAQTDCLQGQYALFVQTSYCGNLYNCTWCPRHSYQSSTNHVTSCTACLTHAACNSAPAQDKYTDAQTTGTGSTSAGHCLCPAGSTGSSPRVHANGVRVGFTQEITSVNHVRSIRR